MEKTHDASLHIMVSLEEGLVKDVQIFRSKESAQEFWDTSIEEAKRAVGYESLSPEDRKAFDQDPFGFAYGGDIDLVWEESSVKD